MPRQALLKFQVGGGRYDRGALPPEHNLDRCWMFTTKVTKTARTPTPTADPTDSPAPRGVENRAQSITDPSVSSSIPSPSDPSSPPFLAAEVDCAPERESYAYSCLSNGSDSGSLSDLPTSRPILVDINDVGNCRYHSREERTTGNGENQEVAVCNLKRLSSHGGPSSKRKRHRVMKIIW